MRRLIQVGLAALVALVVSVPARAQGLSTQANDVLSQMFTPTGLFGLPGYASDPATCGSTTERAVYYNTTTDTPTFCNGVAWAGLGGSSGSFADNVFLVTDNGDSTKKLAFEVSGVATGTTRTWTVPDFSGTVALGTTPTNSQTTFNRIFLTNNNGMYLSNTETSATPVIWIRTEQTPDAPILATGTVSNSWIIAEQADATFDFAHAQQTNPTLFGHSANQSTSQWWSITHNQTNAVLGWGAGQLQLVNAGGANGRPVGFATGSAVASAGTITPTGNVFHVTGTTTITAITQQAAGTCITMIFDGALSITDSATLNIGAAFTSTADDTLTMCSDGTNWYETGRSVN